jgi:G3E family GTPase
LNKRSRVEKEPLDHILIETTGLADPAALVQTFFADEFVAEMCSLDGILTLVDAERLAQQLSEDRDHSVFEKEVAKQLGFADMILLNKIDLVDKEALLQIRTRIRKTNPSVPIRLALPNPIDMGEILNIDAWSLQKVVDTDEGFLDGTRHNVITCQFRDGFVKCFNMAGEEVLASHVPREEIPFGPWLWRAAKGVVPKGRLHLVETNGDDIWVEPLEECVNSVGLDIHGEVDKEKFKKWMSELVREKSEDLFRYKGILALQGQDAPFVFQGMQSRLMGEHVHREGQANDSRRCKIHFMGDNLNREELIAGFMECVILDSESGHELEVILDTVTKKANCNCQ